MAPRGRGALVGTGAMRRRKIGLSGCCLYQIQKIFKERARQKASFGLSTGVLPWRPLALVRPKTAATTFHARRGCQESDVGLGGTPANLNECHGEAEGTPSDFGSDKSKCRESEFLF